MTNVFSPVAEKQTGFNQHHINFRLIPEIKRAFKDSHLEMRTLVCLKQEFQKSDIYSFTFSNDKELKYYIENMKFTNLPEALTSLLYQAIVNPTTKKINFLLLK